MKRFDTLHNTFKWFPYAYLTSPMIVAWVTTPKESVERALILFWVLFFILMTYKIWRGIELRILLTKRSLPPNESNLFFHDIF